MMKRIKSLLLWSFVLFALIGIVIWIVTIGLNKFDYMKRKNVIRFEEKILEKQLKFLDAQIGDPIFIRIFKEENIFEVWIETESEYKLLKEYLICAYSGELGPKLQEGDGQAPEGFYRVYKSSLNPNSKYHLSFNLGFPNQYDRSHDRTGSYLMVHGSCASAGCYAMTDTKIEEIYNIVEKALGAGQAYVPVHIFPFRMSDDKLVSYEDHQWHRFWVNLQEGYDYFELEKRPPLVKANNKRYEFFESI